MLASVQRWLVKRIYPRPQAREWTYFGSADQGSLGERQTVTGDDKSGFKTVGNRAGTRPTTAL